MELERWWLNALWNETDLGIEDREQLMLSCAEISRSNPAWVLATVGATFDGILVCVSGVLISKLMPLLRNYAVVKGSLIAAAVASAVVAFTGLALDIHLGIVLALGPARCLHLARPPMLACALSLQLIQNGFRLACLSLAALAVDRLYFATKLYREMSLALQNQNPASLYHSNSDAQYLGPCEGLQKRLKLVRAQALTGIVAVLDGTRHLCCGLPVMFALLVLFSLLISASWWASALVRLLPPDDENRTRGHLLLVPLSVCSDAGLFLLFDGPSLALDKATVLTTTAATLLITMAYHRLCQTQLSNFARSQYHITLTVRIKLRQTVTLAKMLFPPLLINLIWQILCLVIELSLSYTLSLRYDHDLNHHFHLLWTKTLPLIFFCTACIIRVKLEQPVAPMAQPPNHVNFVSAATHTTHPDAVHSIAPRLGPEPSVLPTSAPDENIRGGSSLPPQTKPYRPSLITKTGIPTSYPGPSCRPDRGPTEIDSEHRPFSRHLWDNRRLDVPGSSTSSLRTRRAPEDRSVSSLDQPRPSSVRKASTVVSLPPIAKPNVPLDARPLSAIGQASSFPTSVLYRNVEGSSADNTTSSGSTVPKLSPSSYDI